MITVSLTGVASAFPEQEVGNEYFGQGLAENKSRMFMGTQLRRHIAPTQTAAQLIEMAFANLCATSEVPPMQDIDIILTNVSLPDEPFTGCGAEVNHRIGAKAKWVIDLHNTGCVSFIYMLDIARGLMSAYGAKHALLCNVQTAAGRIFTQPGVRKKALASIPGDGCGVALLSANEQSPILGLVHHCYGEWATDMHSHCDDGRSYWQTGSGEGYVDIDEAKAARIMTRGNRLVPAVIREVCEQVGRSVQEIDILITNQPNQFFLRNWREAIQLPEHRHIHTFATYANLFGAAFPINLQEAIQSKQLKPGDLLCLAGFSHAGDFAAASLVRWRDKQ